jgi:hypothetical protein
MTILDFSVKKSLMLDHYLQEAKVKIKTLQIVGQRCLVNCLDLNSSTQREIPLRPELLDDC